MTTASGSRTEMKSLSEQEYLEALVEEDPYGEATEHDWEDFWLTEEYIEDTEIEEED